MSALRVTLIVLLALIGLALLVGGLATWGVNNHMIGFPYREMTGLGLALLGLAVWVGVA